MNGSGLLNTTTAASTTITAPARTRSVALGALARNVCQRRFRGSNPSFCQGQGITGSSAAYGASNRTSNEVPGQTAPHARSLQARARFLLRELLTHPTRRRYSLIGVRESRLGAAADTGSRRSRPVPVEQRSRQTIEE